jgi:hypothetical protein
VEQGLGLNNDTHWAGVKEMKLVFVATEVNEIGTITGLVSCLGDITTRYQLI